jgi:hypothetical protein
MNSDDEIDFYLTENDGMYIEWMVTQETYIKTLIKKFYSEEAAADFLPDSISI